MKKVVITLITFAILTHLGRTYLPENFHPETTPFFENYWVLTLTTLTIITIICILWSFIKNKLHE